LLTEADLPAAESGAIDRVDFSSVRAQHERCLRQAWSRGTDTADRQIFDRFSAWANDAAQTTWLDDWATFATLKAHFNQSAWFDWPEKYRLRHPQAIDQVRGELADEIEFHKFVQFLFFSQWSDTHAEARSRGVEILGDLPFYVAYDSADVWSNQGIFDLDNEGRPRVVAGVPPDYFSPTGQLWGNPIYRWDRIAESDFDWWVDRLRAQVDLFDRVRIDHFRGFAAYWEVEAEQPTAEHGNWRQGPGEELFLRTSDRLGRLPLVAEDLGLITEDVVQLRVAVDIPGMKVLQFAFDTLDSDHLPHNLEPGIVYYTGTHDNDTAQGWFQSTTEEVRSRALDYVGGSSEEIHWDLSRIAMTSVADLVVIPMQDLLGLGTESRMNIPASMSGNWEWRLDPKGLDAGIATRLWRLAELSGRLPIDGDAPDSASEADST
jgi:4-alpha-glucanotransferase